MASFTDTFERKEVKYRLNAKQHRHVLDALAGRMAEDEFGRSRITSLYFDTPTRDLIARSLEKPLYKEKLRVRWYGQVRQAERVYVELKKKFDGIVYKRRVGCSQAAAMAYLVGSVPYENACVANPLTDQEQQEEALTLRSIQIAREIDAFVKRYHNLRPSMYIVCERTAFAPLPGGGADGLRITFDSGVAYRDAMAAGRRVDTQFHPLLGLGEVIMEVKTSGAFPSWLVEALNGCEAYPSSFSKYGAAYQAVERAAAVACGGAPAMARAASAPAAMRDGAPTATRVDAPAAAHGAWRGASPAADAARAGRMVRKQGAQRAAAQKTAAIDRLAPQHDTDARRVSAASYVPRSLAALFSRKAS